MEKSVTVIINTSDSYSDCWEPFFTLFNKYWSACDASIILNTQREDYEFPGIPIISSRVQLGVRRELTWSECLLACLDRVKSPLVLYLQEDYFLESPVDHAAINAHSRSMLANPLIRHIGLTSFGARGPFKPTADESLWEIAERSGYRISTQAGLWRVDTLRSYLRSDENGWMFEIFGTRRAWRRPELFLTVNRDQDALRPIFPYSHAGIVKGKWDRSMPALFEKNNIEMDFTRRGFYTPKPGWVDKTRTLRKLARNPLKLLPGMLGYS